jgi:hypothetical protein
MTRKFRTKRVSDRADLVFNHLFEYGPSSIASICAGTGLKVHHARYALIVLHNDRKAFVSGFQRIMRRGDIPRHIAIFSLGDERNRTLAGTLGAEENKLDFASTSHLQPLYIDWTATRTPPYEQEEEL